MRFASIIYKGDSAVSILQLYILKLIYTIILF
jgi:hypothetical protein